VNFDESGKGQLQPTQEEAHQENKIEAADSLNE
jgi:hypothetical protein